MAVLPRQKYAFSYKIVSLYSKFHGQEMAVLPRQKYAFSYKIVSLYSKFRNFKMTVGKVKFMKKFYERQSLPVFVDTTGLK